MLFDNRSLNNKTFNNNIKTKPTNVSLFDITPPGLDLVVSIITNINADENSTNLNKLNFLCNICTHIPIVEFIFYDNILDSLILLDGSQLFIITINKILNKISILLDFIHSLIIQNEDVTQDVILFQARILVCISAIYNLYNILEIKLKNDNMDDKIKDNSLIMLQDINNYYSFFKPYFSQTCSNIGQVALKRFQKIILFAELESHLVRFKWNEYIVHNIKEIFFINQPLTKSSQHPVFEFDTKNMSGDNINNTYHTPKKMKCSEHYILQKISPSSSVDPCIPSDGDNSCNDRMLPWNPKLKIKHHELCNTNDHDKYLITNSDDHIPEPPNDDIRDDLHNTLSSKDFAVCNDANSGNDDMYEIAQAYDTSEVWSQEDAMHVMKFCVNF